MIKRELILSAAALIALCVPSAFAQSTTTTTTPDKPESIAQRKDNQQDRIAQGIDSGQMTAGEAARAENNQQKVNQQVHADRQANGGKLTPAEKKQVNHEQNKNSKQIHNEKHNNNEQHPH